MQRGERLELGPVLVLVEQRRGAVRVHKNRAEGETYHRPQGFQMSARLDRRRASDSASGVGSLLDLVVLCNQRAVGQRPACTRRHAVTRGGQDMAWQSRNTKKWRTRRTRRIRIPATITTAVEEYDSTTRARPGRPRPLAMPCRASLRPMLGGGGDEEGRRTVVILRRQEQPSISYSRPWSP